MPRLAPPVAALDEKGEAVEAARTGCCSFFTFDLRIDDGALTLAISTGEAHVAVLDALADRAVGRVGSGR